MSSILPINVDEILPLVSGTLFASIRISGFFFSVPIFSQMTIPNYLKVILTLLIGFIFSPILVKSNPHVFEVFSISGLISAIQEMLIGFAMGLIFQITFEILNLVGQFISTAMQLNFAQIYSPITNSETDQLGSFLQIFAMLIFITMHGPLILLTLLYKSFVALPIGKTVINHFQIKELIRFSGTMFFFSLLLSLPILVTLFIINIGMMVLSRLSTAFNIFTVGFSLTIFAGVITMIISMPLVLDNFMHILRNSFNFILRWQMMR